MSEPQLEAWLGALPPNGRPPTIIRAYRAADASDAAAEMSREAEVLGSVRLRAGRANLEGGASG